MSKYNLSDILNEYIGGGRIGTLKISYKDLVDQMDELEKSGKVIVREKGASADGKVNREFEVVDRNSAVPGGNKQERGFTVYDFKFGFDPGDQDKFMNEYPFSVGGNDLKLAMELIDGVEEYKFEESINEEEGIGQLYVQPAVKKEVKFHLDAYEKGDIEVDDMIQAIEDIIFGRIPAPGMKESVGPSDKAETEDDVVNIDKVAGPSAKGVGYGAETSANTAEDDMEDKEVANPRPMYENGDTSDFTSELKESTQEESVAKYIKDYYRNPKTGESMISDEMVSEYYRTHKDWDQEGRWDGSKEGMEDGMKDFDEFFDANYGYMFDDSRDIDENLKKHFKRFM